jgi:hypothetical protein
MIDIDDIKMRNHAAGFYFFEPATLRFFDSRTLSEVYQGPGGVFFVTSERFHGSTYTGPRLYTVRKFNPVTADIDTHGEYNKLTKYQAQKAARELAAA